jgi:hypothetical protein
VEFAGWTLGLTGPIVGAFQQWGGPLSCSGMPVRRRPIERVPRSATNLGAHGVIVKVVDRSSRRDRYRVRREQTKRQEAERQVASRMGERLAAALKQRAVEKADTQRCVRILELRRRR